MVMIRDVTEILKVSTLQQAKDLYVGLGKKVSRDLLTPLNTIKESANQMESFAQDNETVHLLKCITLSTNVLLNVAHDYVDLNAFVEKKLQPRVKIVNI